MAVPSNVAMGVYFGGGVPFLQRVITYYVNVFVYKLNLEIVYDWLNWLNILLEFKYFF